jgi:hypothetical protein
MRILLRVLACLIALTVKVPARQGCAIASERDALKVRDWSQLKRWYGQYGHCDNASAEEVLSDFVTHRLARFWDIGVLQRQMVRDARFGSFVVAGLNATADYDELRRVIRNAETRCPDGARALCRRLSAAASEALEEAAEVDAAAKP